MLIGLNILVWAQTRVNYAFIFGVWKVMSGLTLGSFFRVQNSTFGPAWTIGNILRWIFIRCELNYPNFRRRLPAFYLQHYAMHSGYHLLALDHQISHP
jgi:hypothetical protein